MAAIKLKGVVLSKKLMPFHKMHCIIFKNIPVNSPAKAFELGEVLIIIPWHEYLKGANPFFSST